MLPVLVTGGLFQPVSLQEARQKTPTGGVEYVRNIIRGRILASFVKPGMNFGEVKAILGTASCCYGTFDSQIHSYRRTLGVAVGYRTEEIQVSGETETEFRSIVESVRIEPLSDLLPRFPLTRAEKPPALTR